MSYCITIGLPMSRKIGQEFEQEALKFLRRKHLKLIESNYTVKCGEIDHIMQEQDSLVFVEVRYRKEDDYGEGLESVSKSKQAKLIRAAKTYLQEHALYDKIACRFDVVSIDKQHQINWIQNAFDAND